MSDGPPNLYFRVRENGAVVFRIDLENRQRRLDMQQIAVLNSRNGDIKSHGDTTPTKDEMTAIENWIVARREALANRDVDDILRAVDHLNLTAQWAQARATDAQLEEITDRLLMAMHDLRSVLVRKKSDRLSR